MSEEYPTTHPNGFSRLEEMAVRQRWKITPEMREEVAKRQYEIAVDESSTPRAASIAAKTLAAMESQNQVDDLRTGAGIADINPLQVAAAIESMGGRIDRPNGRHS